MGSLITALENPCSSGWVHPLVKYADNVFIGDGWGTDDEIEVDRRKLWGKKLVSTSVVQKGVLKNGKSAGKSQYNEVLHKVNSKIIDENIIGKH